MDSMDLERSLAHFTGTEQWYRHPFNSNFLYTDGVKFFSEHAGGGAYWFLDIVATEIFALQKDNPFMSITLKAQDGKGEITVGDGDLTEVFNKPIEFTDCPDGEWKFFLIDGVLLLPSEY